MKYLKSFNNINESNSHQDDIIAELNDIALDIIDDGFKLDTRWFKSLNNRIFLICSIQPSKFKWVDNDEINQNIIDTVNRMVDFMHQNSFDLGKYWLNDGEGKLRIFRKVGENTPYVITLDELDEFINIDFKSIEMTFTPLILNWSE